MAFEKVTTNYHDHDEEWVRIGTHGQLTLSQATVERWFDDVDRVEFLADRETGRVVIMPETASGDEADKRKLSYNESGYAAVSIGAVCNEFGFSGQDIEESVMFEVEQNGQYAAPMFDMSELVERYGGNA